MCTVILQVPADPNDAVRVIAVRDEDPERPWDAPGLWWPEVYPGVSGVRDRRAGGAWLATAASRLAVVLNREDVSARPASDITTRGALVLDAVTGTAPDMTPTAGAFNLVSVSGGTATVVSWDGLTRTEQVLSPGTHMIAHDDVDDLTTARIEAWLPQFRLTESDAAASDDWFEPWLEVLNTSAELSPSDDRAIIRDNNAHGYPTLSLLVCVATVGGDGLDLRYGTLSKIGESRQNRTIRSANSDFGAILRN